MSLFRRTRWTAVVGVAGVVALSLGAGSAGKVAKGREPAVPDVDRTPERIAEVGHIRAHFDSVLAELSSRDVGSLTVAQRSNRAALAAELGRYRDRGVFPHNYDFAGPPVPYFVDRKTGTLCAAANLLAFSGRRDIVDRVAASNNNVWVAELAGDSAFTNWLDTNGLTLHEAARIQVAYSRPVSTPQIVGTITIGLATPAAMLLATTSSLWNLTGNADGHSAGWRWVGMLSGAAATGAGTYFLNKPDLGVGVTKAAVASMGMGALSMAVSSHSFYRHHEIVAEQESAAKRAVAETSVAPIVTPDGRAGLGVSVRF